MLHVSPWGVSFALLAAFVCSSPCHSKDACQPELAPSSLSMIQLRAQALSSSNVTTATNFSSRAIVVFSNRELPCSNRCWEQLRDYADRVNATLHHVRDLHGPEFQHVGRQCMNKLESDEVVRFAKYAMMPFFLQQYAEVALFDDSIIVSKFAPDIFSLGVGKQAVKGTYDASPILQEHCDTYGVPRDKCALERRLVNSGLLVFSQEHHLQLFNEPCERWNRSGGFYDQSLFNAMFMKHRTPIFDLNGEGGAAEPHLCSSRSPVSDTAKDFSTSMCPAFREWVGKTSSCFLLFGMQMAILSKSKRLTTAAESSCFAHVTRGAFEERDHLLCNISSLLLCKSQVARSRSAVQPPIELLKSPTMVAPLPQQGGASLANYMQRDWAGLGSMCRGDNEDASW